MCFPHVACFPTCWSFAGTDFYADVVSLARLGRPAKVALTEESVLLQCGPLGAVDEWFKSHAWKACVG
mgnify:CR=1 FL=1